MKSAMLYINNKLVGTVALRHSADSWGMGDFTPNDAFGEFAPLFGSWSLIMHDDAGGRRLDDVMQQELHRAEMALDALRVRLLMGDHSEWIDVGQVVIDGPMIEWKVMGRRPARPRTGSRAAAVVNVGGTSRPSPAGRPRGGG